MPTFYSVTGKSRTKPVDLPAGYEVEEENRPFAATIDAPGGWSLKLREVTAHLRIGARDVHGDTVEDVGLDRSGVIALRKALDEWLGESGAAVSRVFKDRDKDLWFEVEHDKFIMAWAWNGATLKFREDPTGYNRSFLNIKTAYSPLTDVTADYPRPTN